MALQHAYATTNLLDWDTVDPSSFWLANNERLTDGRVDKQAAGSQDSSDYFYVMLPAPTAINCVALLNHNICSLGTDAIFTLYGADDAGFSVNLVTKAASTFNTQLGREKDHVFCFPSATRQHWKGVIQWTGTTPQDIRCGELYFGVATPLTRYHAIPGRGESARVEGAAWQSDVGEQRMVFQAGPRRMKRLSWSDISEADRLELQTMYLAAQAAHGSLLWIDKYVSSLLANTADEQDVILGKPEQSAFRWAQNDHGRFEPAELVLRALTRGAGD